MYKLEIESASGIYQIEFLKVAVVPDSDSVFLVDRKIAEKVSANSSRYVAIEAIEEEKTLRKCEEILVNLAFIEFRRGDTLNVVGGGFIQDLGTLVSSIYMRGVKWNYFPTTLASMGDSCIGGKSSKFLPCQSAGSLLCCCYRLLQDAKRLPMEMELR